MHHVNMLFYFILYIDTSTTKTIFLSEQCCLSNSYACKSSPFYGISKLSGPGAGYGYGNGYSNGYSNVPFVAIPQDLVCDGIRQCPYGDGEDNCVSLYVLSKLLLTVHK